ncbi:hypothetical protein N7462_010093 [Penicillium macrosclerotiorum]|uniref:uncharacterized protein n=1 Tax=Penicillium macrosclerotiorum TaxID=303699 RepID=UPI002548F134|nr:uncharacterized protein N7462_010093 [Penicillium macrosclerotiorum]KAJ5669023.1 hypothetical protein N7462_010093 [Penicillium macrosclerotiorum]
MPILSNGSEVMTEQMGSLSLRTNGSYPSTAKQTNGFHQIKDDAVPRTQWAQVARTSGKGIDLKQILVSKPRPDEILVKIEFSGVCHTDLHAWKGFHETSSTQLLDLLGGHEGAGYVVALGSQVHDLHIGDTVGIQWINRTCGACEFCIGGNQPLCPGIQLSGCNVDGTFQQYCIVKSDNAVRIPHGIPLEIAAPILCAGITVYKALLEAEILPGQTVAIVGAGGGLGSLACQYAKAMGFKVLAISSGESKKRMCLVDLQVNYYVDYKSLNVVEEVKRSTSGGPHAAVIVSSVEEPFHQSLRYIRPGGTIIAVGLPPGKMSTDIFAMVTQKVNIKGSYVGNRHETEEALAIMVRAGFKLQSKVVDFDNLTKVYDLMEKGTRSNILGIHSPLSNHIRTNAWSGGSEHWGYPVGTSRPLWLSHLPSYEGYRESDTVTVPDEHVMQAIVNDSTFDDDVYDGQDPSVNRLLERVIQLTGKEAALFVASGTMGNQICLRTHLHQPPHAILLDHRAHVQCWETGALPILSQATVTGVEPKNGIYLTLDDLKGRIIEENNIHFPPTRIVCLENQPDVPVPQGRKPIAMHLDGARLWDAVAGEGVGMMAAAALAALDNHLSLLPKVHALARQVGDYLQSIGYKLLFPVNTNMIVLDLKKMDLPGDLMVEICKQRGVRAFPNGRLVFHIQTSDDGVSRLQAALHQLIKEHGKNLLLK